MHKLEQGRHARVIKCSSHVISVDSVTAQVDYCVLNGLEKKACFPSNITILADPTIDVSTVAARIDCPVQPTINLHCTLIWKLQ